VKSIEERLRGHNTRKSFGEKSTFLGGDSSSICFDTCRAPGLGFIKSFGDYAAKTVDGQWAWAGGFVRCSSMVQCYNLSSNIATSIFPIFKTPISPRADIPTTFASQHHHPSLSTLATPLFGLSIHNPVVSEPSSSANLQITTFFAFKFVQYRAYSLNYRCRLDNNSSPSTPIPSKQNPKLCFPIQ